MVIVHVKMRFGTRVVRFDFGNDLASALAAGAYVWKAKRKGLVAEVVPGKAPPADELILLSDDGGF